MLELRETAKKVTDQVLVCRIGNLWRTWMIANWLYMSPSDSLNDPGSIFYHSESSEVPYSTISNWSGTCFCCYLQQTDSRYLLWNVVGIGYGIGQNYWLIWVSVLVSNLNQNSGFGCTLKVPVVKSCVGLFLRNRIWEFGYVSC